jgi:hypothetical protein
MRANRMNRDQFYTAMAPNDDTRLRKVLWTLYWRGNAQLRERIEDEIRSPEQPKVKPKKELPDPGTVLDEVTAFVTLAKDGAYMAGGPPGCTTPSGPSGGSRSVGWWATRWRRSRPRMPGQRSRPSRRWLTLPAT